MGCQSLRCGPQGTGAIIAGGQSRACYRAQEGAPQLLPRCRRLGTYNTWRGPPDGRWLTIDRLRCTLRSMVDSHVESRAGSRGRTRRASSTHGVSMREDVRTGDEILSVATDLYYQFGYANVGMRMVAKHVGVQPASLYHHFDSKESILYEIALTVTERFAQNNIGILEEADPKSGLRNIIIRQILGSWEYRPAIAVTRRERRELSSEHQEIVAGHERAYRQRLAAHISSAMNEGIFPSGDADLFVLAIQALVNNVAEWYHEDGRYSLQEIAEWHADTVLTMLSAGTHQSSGAAGAH